MTGLNIRQTTVSTPLCLQPRASEKGGENADSGAEDTASEADEADQPEQQEGETETEADEPDAEKQADQFTLKHLDETKTVSKDEVVQLAQKGMDYDRVRQKYDEQTSSLNMLKAEKDAADGKIGYLENFAKDAGYRSLDDMIDDVKAGQIAEQTGVDKAVAMRQVQLDRREAALAEKEARQQQAKTAQASAAEQQAATEAKRQTDFQEFAGSEYGRLDPKDIPTEVWQTYNAGGCTLVQAYMQHENAQLKAQMAAKAKNAENKQRSAGSRKSAGAGQKTDPWADAWAHGE